MPTKLETFIQSQIKTNIPDIRSGDTIRLHQKGEGKKRGQIFEGIVIARKHGKEAGSTITVRKIVAGVGVEKIFPLHSPAIEKIEILRRGKARRAKLYYLREAKGKRARLKQRAFAEVMPVETKEGVPKDIENVEKKQA